MEFTVFLAGIFPPFLSLLEAEFSGRICRYLPGFSGRICNYWQQDFPAVSVVTCRDFLALPFSARECKKSPSRDQKAGIFRPYLLFPAGIFWP
jgi:hypothetical protein